ncbi:hypothetical protein Bca4012_039614 [Brassica carinata]
MAETSNLISKAKEFLATKTSEEVAIAIHPLFTRQETSEYKASRALYECCVANFPHFLIPKLLTAYLHTSDGVLRFRTIYLLSEFRNRSSSVHLSPLALRVIKPLVVACLKMKETKESDVKILRRLVSFVAYSVVMSDDGGWDELSGCIVEFADSSPYRAFHVFLDLPLVYKKFIHQDVMERVLDQAKKVLFSPDKARVEYWSLALQTLFKIGVLGSDVVVESIVLRSAEEVVKIGKREFLERGLEDIKKFLSRDGSLCKYSKEQRVFVSRLAFNIAACCHQTIEDSKKVASEISRLVRKPSDDDDDDHHWGSGFDIDWCDHLNNLSPMQVLRIFARADDLGERSRELAIRRLHASLSDHDSVFVGTSRHISLIRKLQPLLIPCLEEDGISDSMFRVLCEVVNYVNSDMLIFEDETWQGLRDYIVSKTKTKFQRAVYVFSCLTEQLDVDKFVIPVMLNLLPEISAKLNPPREFVVVDNSWVLAFTGAFCAIIHLINIDTCDDHVKEIAYKMIDSVRELVERGMEVGVVRRGFRDLESIVKKQLTWYGTSEYKFVKGLLWRLYEIKGMKMESRMVLWRINAIVERGVTEDDKELPEGELDWINKD